ncbi:MAG: Coenzyme F420 hydrogenase/dehydrogenase, beta subunit C-terminal domain, partial [Planctomycetota bacterium]
HRVESAPAPCVFIGKPCDVAATWKARALRSRLDGNLGLTIAIFCAGTPSTEGTLAMLRSMGVESGDEIVGLRYRGNGWPGRAEVTLPGGDGDGEERRSLSYEESWGEILQKHRQWRCALCADHTGEFADIAVGDPWYRPTGEGDPGRSLVIVRTERGRRLLAEAMESGTLTLERVDPALLPASQPNLLRTRGAIWGRLLVCRWMGAAVPRYLGVPALRFWWSELGLREKAQSIYGTVKRVIVRRLRRRIDYRQAVAPARRSSSSHSAPSPAEAVEGERLVGAQKGKA